MQTRVAGTSNLLGPRGVWRGLSNPVLCPVENGCDAMANSLLVRVPNIQAHAALSTLIKGRILTPYVTVGAVKYIVKVIAKSLSATKVAPAKVTREGRPGIPNLLHERRGRLTKSK